MMSDPFPDHAVTTTAARDHCDQLPATVPEALARTNARRLSDCIAEISGG
ncbi:hypothetical protein ACQ86G_03170 [Roseateles chitinivorans]